MTESRAHLGEEQTSEAMTTKAFLMVSEVMVRVISSIELVDSYRLLPSQDAILGAMGAVKQEDLPSRLKVDMPLLAGAVALPVWELEIPQGSALYKAFTSAVAKTGDLEVLYHRHREAEKEYYIRHGHGYRGHYPLALNAESERQNEAVAPLLTDIRALQAEAAKKGRVRLFQI